MKKIYGNCQRVENVCITLTDTQRVFGSFIKRSEILLYDLKCSKLSLNSNYSDATDLSWLSSLKNYHNTDISKIVSYREYKNHSVIASCLCVLWNPIRLYALVLRKNFFFFFKQYVLVYYMPIYLLLREVRQKRYEARLKTFMFTSVFNGWRNWLCYCKYKND